MSRVLLTKLRNATPDSSEWAYNNKLGHTRTWVEQTFGHWVGMWRLIGKEHRSHYAVQKTRDLIVAAAVLYNFQKRNGSVLTNASLKRCVFDLHSLTTNIFFRKPAIEPNPDPIEIRAQEHCTIANGIEEAIEIIEKYL